MGLLGKSSLGLCKLVKLRNEIFSNLIPNLAASHNPPQSISTFELGLMKNQKLEIAGDISRLVVSGSTSSPWQPSWLFKPRVATLEDLISVERSYLENLLPDTVYASWMSINGGMYQLNNSPRSMGLWQEFFVKAKLCVKTGVDERRSRKFSPCHTISGRLVCVKLDEYYKYCGIKPFRAKAGEGVAKIVSFKSATICFCESHKLPHLLFRRLSSYSRKDLKFLNFLYPWATRGDKTKTNLDLASIVYRAMVDGREAAVQRAFEILPLGLWNVTATAVVIMYLGSAVVDKISVILDECAACCLTNSNWQSFWKPFSIAVRRTAHWFDGTPLGLLEIAHLAYWELPIGRDLNKSDWVKEKTNRLTCTKPLVDIAGLSTVDDLRKLMIGVVEELLSSKRTWSTWVDFVKSRQSWVSGGSSGGAKIQSINEVGEQETLRLNKHSYFETLSTSEIAAWLYEEPVIKAVASEKLEMGKSRAIYGTLPPDYTIMSYVIEPLEKVLYNVKGVESGVRGFLEVLSIAKRRQLVNKGKMECSMIDYTDFNIQHTLEAQSIVFEAIGMVLSRDKHTPIDVLTACEWCRRACLNQKCKFPGDTNYVEIKQGLFSGMRGTNFVNTLLNVCYFRLGKLRVEQLLGLHPIHLHTIHQGDDVWITNRSRLWAIGLYHVMKAIGLDFQESKQMFDVNRGEFLRVLYSESGARGYLMRAVATMIEKPIQAIDELAPQARATAYNSQVHLLYRRGLEKGAAHTVWWALVPHALKLHLGSKGSEIPLTLARADYRDGGLDLGPPGTSAIRSTKLPPIPSMCIRTNEMASMVPSNMSRDWIEHISSRVSGPFDAKAVEMIIHNANVSDSLRPIDRQRSLKHLIKALDEWHVKFKNALELSSVARPRRRRDQLVFEESRFKRLAGVLLERKMQILRNVPDNFTDLHETPGVVASILAGVAASPFRDISTACLALKCGTFDAIKQCFSLAKPSSTVETAKGWVYMLTTMLNRDVAVRIVQGIRGLGPSFESLLHPIIHSWATHTATDFAIFSSLNMGVRNTQEWDALLAEWQHAVVSYLVEDGTVVDLSHY